MSTRRHYDSIVIGSGQAGKPLAIALAESGRKTAIVERAYIGGSCINWGCTPTKTMVASARVAYLARRAADYGVHLGTVAVTMAEVRRRKQKIVESFRDGGQRRLERTSGLDLMFGAARFIGPKAIEVQLKEGGAVELEARELFINIGCRPAVPELPGLDEVPFLDSSSIMELEELPEHLLVLGGGYIGLEFGQMFRRFGSRVTVIQRGPYLLAREDPDVAEEVAKVVREDGIDVRLSTEAARVARSSGGNLQLEIRGPEGETTVAGSHLLVATGRVPCSDDLGLAAAGIQTDEHGFIRANERLETGVPGVYALGDVKGGPAFTHISYDDYRIIRTNLIEGGAATTRGRLAPYTVFIDPQLGRVGLTETEARKLDRPVEVAKMPMSHVARALEMDESRGFMKAVVDAGSGQILGAAVLGIEGGELMAVLQMAMIGKVPFATVREAIFAHPTLAESLNNLFGSLER
jgi:pyruvate/2-oxoglutarate dehydrogenase complex dihydrolipoamide dehydrogenase (E3) component